MRFLYGFVLLMVFAAPCGAGQNFSFRELVLLAEKRPTYVSVMVPEISSLCMERQWGENPPIILRQWLSNLMLSDLENRAKVIHGEMSPAQSARLREEHFFSLENLQPHEFEKVAIYAHFSPNIGFGEALIQVLECQYRSLGETLALSQESANDT